MSLPIREELAGKVRPVIAYHLGDEKSAHVAFRAETSVAGVAGGIGVRGEADVTPEGRALPRGQQHPRQSWRPPCTMDAVDRPVALLADVAAVRGEKA